MSTPAAEARLTWRTHAARDGGYVRTAIARDGSLIINSFLADFGRGGQVIPIDRMVVIPAALADAFVRGLVADTKGKAGA